MHPLKKNKDKNSLSKLVKCLRRPLKIEIEAKRKTQNGGNLEKKKLGIQTVPTETTYTNRV